MNMQKRITLLYCTLIFAFSLLLARLYNLSKPDTNKSMSVLDGQYTGKIKVCERSGFVYDRNGNLISHDVSGKIALINPAECRDIRKSSEEIAKRAKVSSLSDIYEKIMSGIPFTVLLSEDADKTFIEGVYVFDVYEENKTLAKHFLGYNNADGEGMCGLRGAYKELLGKELFSSVTARFDTNAKRISLSPFELETEKYLTNDGIVTTLDKDLQGFCDGFEGEIKSGAIVVSDVKSGEILALSSFPSYDPDNLEEVLFSESGELINRAREGFTPGSVFKIVVCAAALEKDASLYDLKYTCEGKINVGDDVFNCHNRSGHGELDMKGAFANSCNTYFINLGRIIGIDSILDVLERLELDKAAEADFLKELTNYYPENPPDSEGYLANISFGQGDLCFSPLDMINITTASATGFVVPLSSVRGEIREGGFFSFEKEGKKRVFSENTARKILEMMKECVQSGTGTSALTKGVNVGGKTATAQTGRFDAEGVEYVHKWFCGVYPVENPRFSICVICDNELYGNVSPGEFFCKICEYLLEKDVEE